jgi:hypothetical protein
MPKAPIATSAPRAQLATPPIPDSDLWTDHLHWCIKVMPYDDPDAGFIGGLLSYAHANNGLTPKQAKYAQRTMDRLRSLYHRAELPSQIDVHAQEAEWLWRQPTGGNA